MTKRRLIRWSLILAILAAFAVWLEPTRVVWGWLRGEAFYQGRPTSWWREQLRRFRFEQSEKKQVVRNGDDPPRFETVIEKVLVEHADTDEGGLRGFVANLIGDDGSSSPWDKFFWDQAADPVLSQLQADTNPEIQAKAIELARLRRAAKE